MMAHDQAEPTEQLERALQAARNELPEGHDRIAIFRRLDAWPENWQDLRFDPDTLYNAITYAPGQANSVFAFPRYHDYVHFRQDSNSIGFESRQNDEWQPLYVYWQVNRLGIDFQHSQQPDIAGDRLSLDLTARYVASAIDFVGLQYSGLGFDGNVSLRITLTGTGHRHLDVYRLGIGPGEGCPERALTYWERCSVDEWRADREEAAVRFTLDLLHQCGRLPDMFRNQISQAVLVELQRIDSRRGAIV